MGIDLGSCNTRDVRHLTAEDLVLQIERCFDIESLDILELRVSRIDFTADVKDLPVEWFRRHRRVRQKRLSTQWREVTKSGVTSLEIGKRPDLYRIYNKVQERKDKGKKVL